jgi:hypothetical protein
MLDNVEMDCEGLLCLIYVLKTLPLKSYSVVVVVDLFSKPVFCVCISLPLSS